MTFPPKATRLLNEVKVKIIPEQAMKVRSRIKSYSCNLSLTSVLDEGGWSTPRPVWAGAENITPTVLRSPDRLLY